MVDVKNVVTNLMMFYINSTVAVLSRCSYKIGGNYTGVHAIVRVHANFLGILCACTRSFVCVHERRL